MWTRRTLGRACVGGGSCMASLQGAYVMCMYVFVCACVCSRAWRVCVRARGVCVFARVACACVARKFHQRGDVSASGVKSSGGKDPLCVLHVRNNDDDCSAVFTSFNITRVYTQCVIAARSGVTDASDLRGVNMLSKADQSTVLLRFGGCAASSTASAATGHCILCVCAENGYVARLNRKKGGKMERKTKRKIQTRTYVVYLRTLAFVKMSMSDIRSAEIISYVVCLCVCAFVCV